jgi:hypothetical protein
MFVVLRFRFFTCLSKFGSFHNIRCWIAVYFLSYAIYQFMDTIIFVTVHTVIT